MSAAEILATAALAPATAQWVVAVSPPYRITQFLLGVLLAVGLRRIVLPAVRLAPALVSLCLLAVVVWHVLPNLSIAPQAVLFVLSHVRAPLLPLAYGLVIVAAARRDVLNVPSVLACRPLVALGQWSFALYLVHLLVVFWLLAALGTSPAGNANVLVLLGVAIASVALSALLFSCYERPVERWLRAHRPWSSQDACGGRS